MFLWWADADVDLLIRPSVGMRCGVGALEVREWKIFDKIATWFLRVGLNVMSNT
jgi:hypothetical protein